MEKRANIAIESGELDELDLRILEALRRHAERGDQSGVVEDGRHVEQLPICLEPAGGRVKGSGAGRRSPCPARPGGRGAGPRPPMGG